MKTNYQFSNQLGIVYESGTLRFTPDGNSLISPVGNRLSVFDLANNLSFTFPWSTPRNITMVDVTPNGVLGLAIDEGNFGILFHWQNRVVISSHQWNDTVSLLKFSPCGKYFAVGCGKAIQIWKTPGVNKEFRPFALLDTRQIHSDVITSFDWSPDSQYFISGARDAKLRLSKLNPEPNFERISDDNGFPQTKTSILMAGARSAIVACYFDKEVRRLFTVAVDGALFVWNYDESKEIEGSDLIGRWVIESKHLFHEKIQSAHFHKETGLIVIGFRNGTFGTWELPNFTELHKISVSRGRITAVAINSTGEWFAFGIPSLGQLLVWEWQSERYVMKQQGHYFDMKCLAYGPEGRYIATGGEDSKLKIWKTDDGFCFVTFTEHSGPITGIVFSATKQLVVTSSLDGTCRAFDLLRYRNFRVFTSPTPRQFTCIAVDESGDIVAAGCADTFEIYIWHMQTGRLLDVLEGHEGPVCCLAFNPSNAHLVSGSWDHTVKTWDVFGGDKVHKETFVHNSDVLALAVRPDGKQVVTSTMDGHLTFWDPINGLQTGVIEVKKDVQGGRKATSVRTAKTSVKGKYFTSVTYTADGRCVIGGGESKYVCIYEVSNRILLRKFPITNNRSLDGISEFLDSRLLTEAGHVDEIDHDKKGILDDRPKMDQKGYLPGVQSGKYDKKKKSIRSTQVMFSPNGRQWACCSTVGTLIYSLDSNILFDPYQLDIDITEANIHKTIKEGQYLKALIMSLKLNESHVTKHVFEAIPINQAQLTVNSLHQSYLPLLLSFLIEYSSMDNGTPHIEFLLQWISFILLRHGQYLKTNSATFGPSFRGLTKIILKQQEMLQKTCNSNSGMLSYLANAYQQQSIGGSDDVEMADEEKQIGLQILNDNEEVSEDNSAAKSDLPGWY